MMGRNPSDQYEYWESLKKSFPKEFMENAREEYEKNRKPDLWDRLDGDIKKSLKDDDGITVSGGKTDGGVSEHLSMDGSKVDIELSWHSPDGIMELLATFVFDDGKTVEVVPMDYVLDDEESDGEIMSGVSRVVDYFRERTKLGQEHWSQAFNDSLYELTYERMTHRWDGATNFVARHAVVSARHGYLHERWDANDERRERYDSLPRPDSHLFSSDDGKAVVLMTFLDDSPCPDVSLDMYARRFDSGHDGWNVNHKVLPFISEPGLSFTARVFMTINSFLYSSGIKKE